MEESQLESGGGHTLHHALSQHHPCLSWAERYKIALDMASSLASHEIFIHAHGELKPSDIFLGSKETELWDTTKPTCVEDFGKVLYALISAKENSATLPSSIVGDHRRLGRAEYRVYRAALWLRHHTIPPLPWACPLRRYYILNEADVDGRVRNEIMASGRAIVQLATATRVVVQCTQDDPGSRPTMAKVYSSLVAANSSEIPWSLTAAVSIGFRLYRSLATLVYVVAFLYVGIYKSLGLLVYYFPYACAAYDYPPGYDYDPLDALILVFSLLALMWVVLRTVYGMNRLDNVLYLE